MHLLRTPARTASERPTHPPKSTKSLSGRECLGCAKSVDFGICWLALIIPDLFRAPTPTVLCLKARGCRRAATPGYGLHQWPSTPTGLRPRVAWDAWRRNPVGVVRRNGGCLRPGVAAQPRAMGRNRVAVVLWLTGREQGTMRNRLILRSAGDFAHPTTLTARSCPWADSIRIRRRADPGPPST